jgi:uncharacterized protein (DUF433 family)
MVVADEMPIEPGRGVYDTHRAAALSGVPYRTLHYWASSGIYVPSINPEPRTRLWSWRDLLAVRALYWFRRRSGTRGQNQARPIPNGQIHDMLAAIEREGGSREGLERLVAVLDGEALVLRVGGEPSEQSAAAREPDPDTLHLVKPFLGAPDLLEPRPLLRIIPGKLHGEPHVVRTRISTAVLYRLAEMDYPADDILAMYPSIWPEALAEALDLEQSLHRAA